MSTNTQQSPTAVSIVGTACIQRFAHIGDACSILVLVQKAAMVLQAPGGFGGIGGGPLVVVQQAEMVRRAPGGVWTLGRRSPHQQQQQH